MSARGSLAMVESFGDFLDGDLRKIYTDELKNRLNNSMIPMLYGMETSTKNYEKYSGAGYLSDVPEFDGSLSYDTPSQLYDVTVEFPERALGMKIQRMLADDDLHGIFNRMPWQMAASVAVTREKSGASTFIDSFTSAVGGDGKALCATDHPYSPDDATTQSNKGTSAASATAVEATRIIGLTSIFTDRGGLADVNYDTILCAPQNQETFYELIASAGKVNTANNNKNFHRGRYDLVVWPRLTNSYHWWMLDSKMCKMYNLWVDRIMPEFNYDRDFDNYQAKWSTYMRYNTIYAGWHWLYGHQATS